MVRHSAFRGAALALILLAVGALQAAAQAPATLTVTSPSFKHNEPLPKDVTADGRNVSPALAWAGAPATTKEFALILDDPDANFGGRGPFVHWVIYKIPGTAAGLPEGVPAGASITAPGLVGAINGANGFMAFQRPGQPSMEPGYRGPAPPPGSPHHYRFTVYALNAPVDTKEGLDKAGLLKAMEGKIVAQGELVGIYERARQQ